jgi:hypothetical protein
MTSELKKHIFSILTIVTSIIILVLLGIYGTPLNSDYVIMFNGGYNIAAGLSPFSDFSAPPMPIPFYLQGLIMNFFGANLFSMAILSILLGSILSIYFYFLIKDYFNKLVSILFSIGLFYSFMGLASFPWYNQIAFFFVLLNYMFITKSLLNKNKKLKHLLIISSIFTILSLFSKPEIGTLHLLSILVFFVYAFRERWKKILIYYCAPTILSFFFFNRVIEMASSLNPFSFTNQVVLKKLILLCSLQNFEKIIFSVNFYFLIFIIYFLIRESKVKALFYKFKNQKNRLTILLVLILGITQIIQLTSGQSDQTRLHAIPLSCFLIYLIIFHLQSTENKINIKKRQIKTIIVFSIFLLLISNFNALSNYNAINYHKTPTQQIKYIFLGSPNYIKGDFGCYKGTLFRQQEYDNLQKIRSLIEKHNQNFFISGEFQFLYCDYDKLPPKFVPLWIDLAATMPEKDIPILIEKIIFDKPSLIIFQPYSFSDSNINYTSTEFKRNGYNLTLELESAQTEPIFIYEILK